MAGIGGYDRRAIFLSDGGFPWLPTIAAEPLRAIASFLESSAGSWLGSLPLDGRIASHSRTAHGVTSGGGMIWKICIRRRNCIPTRRRSFSSVDSFRTDLLGAPAGKYNAYRFEISGSKRSAGTLDRRPR